MKKIVGLIICFCTFCIVNVSAETLSLKLISEDNKDLKFDVVVTNVMGANNVFEGEVKYDKNDINSIKLVAADGWELYTKLKDNSVRFIALSMENVAVENTTLFKVNTDVKKETKLTLGNIGVAGGNVGVTLGEVTYTYKEIVVEDNKPVIDSEIKPDVKDEEVSIPSDDLINNIEDNEIIEEVVDKKEDKETKKDNELSKTIVSILVAIAIVTLAFIFLFRKRKGGVK